MNLVRKLAVVIVLLVSTSVARADLIIDYRIEFTVEEIRSCNYIVGPYTCDIEIGDVYLGFFSIESDILNDDGLNLEGIVTAFVIEIEGYIWDIGNPYPLGDFAGFRGPSGFLSDSPGIDVLNGEMTNFRGGVYGNSDDPGIDFSGGLTNDYSILCSSAGCNTFSIYTEGDSFAPGERPEMHFGGRLDITRIPEPGTFALLGIGIAGMGLSRRRRKA